MAPGRAGRGEPATGSLAAQRERDDALASLSELRSRQSRLEVDSRLSGDGVALFSPAERAKSDGVPTIAALAIGIVLGALVGAGLAYWRDARAQEFSSRYGPQVLLDAPALAEIPDFRREGLDSRLPILEAPGTESAEGFRFLASRIGISAAPKSNGHPVAHGQDWQRHFPELNDRELAVLSLAASGAPISNPGLKGSGLSRATVDRTLLEILDKLGRGRSPVATSASFDGDELVLRAQRVVRSRERASDAATHRSLAFVAASFHDGTTTLLANTALAAAQEGSRVLAIDGDAVKRDLSRLLLGDDDAGVDERPRRPPQGTRRPAAPRRFGEEHRAGDGNERRRDAEPARPRDGRGGCGPAASVPTRSWRRSSRFATSSTAWSSTCRRSAKPPTPMPLLRSAAAIVLVVPHRSGAASLMRALDRLDLLGIRPDRIRVQLRAACAGAAPRGRPVPGWPARTTGRDRGTGTTEIAHLSGQVSPGSEAIPCAGGRLAVFAPSMAGGGAERGALKLAEGLARRGFEVDLVLAAAEGPRLAEIPPEVRVVDLRARRVLTSPPAPRRLPAARAASRSRLGARSRERRRALGAEALAPAIQNVSWSSSRTRSPRRRGTERAGATG